MSLLAELKRRNVVKVTTVYVITAWLVLQVADVILGNIDAPGWIFQALLLLLGIGLLFAVMFAWLFEITPDGIKREIEVEHSESTTHATGRRLNIALGALATVAVAFIAWDLFAGSSGRDLPSDGVARNALDVEDEALPAETIAVLPLLNMSPNPDNEFFAGGVHEEILTNLSRIDGLQVVSRTTALRYVNSNLSLRDIGRELGARYIVEGSVRRIENHVRITVQLIDAASDVHIWANNYDRELKDVFATQSEVAREISNSLHLEIQPESVGNLANMPTWSVKAYDLYIKAKSIERSELLTESAVRRQRELLEAAVLEDSDFVEAWAYLKQILDEIVIGIIVRDWFDDVEMGSEAHLNTVIEARTRAMSRALALDPDNVETLLAQASEDFIAEKNRETEAERRKSLERILEIDPDNAVAWRHLGWYYRNWGSPSEASDAFLKALELDPLHARNVEAAHTHFRFVGDEDMTAMLTERLTQIAPEVGQQEALGKIPSVAKLDNILRLFIETGDESIIEEFEATYEAEVADFTPRWPGDSLEWYGAVVRILRNNLEGLADSLPEPLPEDASRAEVGNFVYFTAAVLSAQKLMGRTDDAKATAERLLTGFAALKTDQSVAEINPFRLPAALAYSTLGDQAAVADVRQHILDDFGERIDSQIPWIHVAYGYVDLEHAVEALLSQTVEHPNWSGMNWIAMNHSISRPLLVHPDIQAFYVEDGKWIDYLAARVPEYGKYRRQ